MAQWLGALDSLPKDPDLILSTMTAHSCLELQSQGIWCSLLFFIGIKHACKENTHIHISKQTNIYKQQSTLES